MNQSNRVRSNGYEKYEDRFIEANQILGNRISRVIRWICGIKKHVTGYPLVEN